MRRRDTLSLLAKLRIGHARWGRRSLTLLVLAWLNLVLQPCAMAMAGDSASCPDCPAAHVHEHMGAATMAEHDHEMDAGSTRCGGGLIDCVNLDDINQGDRQKQLPIDSGPVLLALPPMEYVHADDRRAPAPFGAGDAARLRGAFPPLHVLHCVYLK